MKATLDKTGLVDQSSALCQASGQPFYNTSRFTLNDLRARASRQQLRADFEAYLDGFSANVQEILDNFEFRNQIPKLSDGDALGALVEKLTSPDINLSPDPVKDTDGTVVMPGLDNHGMGTIFEELVRRFNEANNQEAGEHWTPRDAVRLMAKLVFLPIAEKIESSTYLLYDGACGTGGMLTVADETLKELAAEHGKQVSTHLYGQEISSETAAICMGDLMLKGEGEDAKNIVGGAKHSTLSNDAFPSLEFDFMLSNPPYGKTWKTDRERMGGDKGIRDPRFLIQHEGDPEYSLVTRVSDGQMLFLANKLAKMRQDTPLGSRIAEVHNGSALFTGAAGSGESNIRRWIIERGLARGDRGLASESVLQHGDRHVRLGADKPQARPPEGQGPVDRRHPVVPAATEEPRQEKLRTGGRVTLSASAPRSSNFQETEQSKIFDNAAFGYWKVKVERPLRIVGADPSRVYKPAEIKALKDGGSRAEDAPPVIRKVHRKGVKADPLHGLFEATVDGKPAIVEYEPDAALSDREQIPLQEAGGIEAFLSREVLPYAPDAWYRPESVKIGYEISFARYFYKPQPMRTLEEIRGDIVALEKETEGLLGEILGEVSA